MVPDLVTGACQLSFGLQINCLSQRAFCLKQVLPTLYLRSRIFEISFPREVLSRRFHLMIQKPSESVKGRLS